MKKENIFNLILLVTIIIPIIYLIERVPIFIDEIHHFNSSKLSYSQILRLVDNHPRYVYLITKPILSIFDDILSARYINLIFLSGSIILFSKIALYKTRSYLLTLLFSLLLFFSPLLKTWFVYLRHYSLYVFLVILLSYGLFLRKRRSVLISITLLPMIHFASIPFSFVGLFLSYRDKIINKKESIFLIIIFIISFTEFYLMKSGMSKESFSWYPNTVFDFYRLLVVQFIPSNFLIISGNYYEVICLLIFLGLILFVFKAKRKVNYSLTISVLLVLMFQLYWIKILPRLIIYYIPILVFNALELVKRKLLISSLLLLFLININIKKNSFPLLEVLFKSDLDEQAQTIESFENKVLFVTCDNFELIEYLKYKKSKIKYRSDCKVLSKDKLFYENIIIDDSFIAKTKKIQRLKIDSNTTRQFYLIKFIL